MILPARSRVTFFFSTIAMVAANPIAASDHADPIDPLGKNRQEGGLTDLFVFPVLENDTPAFPVTRAANLPLHAPLLDLVRPPLTSQQQSEIDAVVFILCLHRQLLDLTMLDLEPYTYEIHIDAHTNLEFPSGSDVDAEPVGFDDHDESSDGASRDGARSRDGASDHTHSAGGLSVVEAYARYGGRIADPQSIRPDFTIAFRLGNDASLQNGYPMYPATWNAANISIATGVFDDPFIFPAFFGTNVIGIAIRVPIEMLPEKRTEYLVWATSRKGNRQIDHVGRSVRTQNPRFELLNRLPPSQHVDALKSEHENPSLVRDLALRLNFASLFAYRRWDFVPDVLCFSTRYPCGFPNGRLLTDDVAAILAQHGDTLLYELSFQDNNYRWPRQTSNDRGRFGDAFPYLREPFDSPAHRPPPQLSKRSVAKLVGLVALLLLLTAGSHLLFARWYHRHKLRRRYL